MAVATNTLTTGSSETDAASYLTASITPTANCLVLVAVGSSASTAVNSPAVTGCGMTWVKVSEEFDDGATRHVALFRGMSSSPTTGALTISFGGQTQERVEISVVEFSGVDTSGANGANAIVQHAKESLEGGSVDTDLTVTLGAFASSNNATYGVIRSSYPANLLAGSGFTKTTSVVATNAALGTEFRADNDTTVNFTWSPRDMYTQAIAVEIAAVKAPTVTTQAATNVSSTTATGNGTAVYDGGATISERGICWNTAGTPTTSDFKGTSSGTTGVYSVPMTSLSGGTTYYARAYAINSIGTSYGAQVSFATSGFTNPNNAFSSNNSYTTIAATSGDIGIQLSGDAGMTYSSLLTKTYTGVEGLQTYGNGSTELWGLTWLGSNVTDTNFRLRVGIGSTYQVYKTFGFAPGSSVLLTGIEVSVEAKWDGSTTSIDHIKVKIYYGTSTVPVEAGTMAFATDASGTGALEVYNGSAWKEIVDKSSAQTISGKILSDAFMGDAYINAGAIKESVTLASSTDYKVLGLDISGSNGVELPATSSLETASFYDSSSTIPARQISNLIKFSVYRSAAWTSVNTAGGGLVSFDTKTFDTGNNCDVVHNPGRFIAPITGVYYFNAATGNSTAGGGGACNLRVNGTNVKWGVESGDNTTANIARNSGVSGLLSLAKGDYVEIYFQGGSGSTGLTGSTFSYFEGWFIST